MVGVLLYKSCGYDLVMMERLSIFRKKIGWLNREKMGC
jgi:hypothetical protein